MTDLHTALRAAIEQRLATARAATNGPWTAEHAFRLASGCRCLSCYEDKPYGWQIPEIDVPPGAGVFPVLYEADALFIVANSPDVIIRQCEADLRRLERHQQATFGGARLRSGDECRCLNLWPCPEIRDLASAYALDIPGSQT